MPHLISCRLIFYSLKTVVKRNCVQSSYTYRYNKMLWRQMYRHISLICKIAFVRSPKRKQCRIWCSFYDWRLMNWLLIKTDINSHFALWPFMSSAYDNAQRWQRSTMKPGYVGPPYRRSEIYAARVSYADDDAHRPPQHDFAAAARAALGTDGRTDGHSNVLKRLKHARSAW